MSGNKSDEGSMNLLRDVLAVTDTITAVRLDNDFNGLEDDSTA